MFAIPYDHCREYNNGYRTYTYMYKSTNYIRIPEMDQKKAIS